ncbi:MAG TPA: hypothetical protein DEF45_27320 [Rhodopirellula sp.]|nr:hypothetical protein [Rhodopirellula sp.]
MGSARDVIRVWCDRLDSWFLPGAAIDFDSERRDPVLSQRPALCVLGDHGVETVPTLSLSDRFVVELDNDVTRSILRNACSFTVVVSSRWGHDPQCHWDFGQLLMRSASEAYCRGAVLLVADGSAVEPWARHASKLTGAKLLRVGFGEQNHQQRPHVWVRFPDGTDISRDEGIITIADRIDAVHVRRGGRIEACLKRRLKPTSERCFSSCDVRVGVAGKPDSVASRLIEAGAVGWFVSQATDLRELVGDQEQDDGTHQNETGCQRVSVPSILPGLCTTRDWLNEPDRWLVHCTRATKGPWPGETLAEYRDIILTQNHWHANRTALDALCRIIQSGELTSSAILSSRRYPVVCWSAVPLLDLLQQRCFRPHVQRWDYEPYGVAVRVRAIRELGGRPVIYGQSGDADKLPVSERFRHQTVGRTIDWRAEKEWRLADSLSLVSLKPRDVRIFALDSGSARSRLVNLPWKVTMLKHLSKRTLKKTGSDGLSEIWKAV